ncbi:MAG TPA: DUF3179 domain-containing (seleno)protein [Gemmataceae bacterium]|nr:DUF3179 domain-containing (seleno)protein [Gemmataceae bacterium]
MPRLGPAVRTGIVALIGAAVVVAAGTWFWHLTDARRSRDRPATGGPGVQLATPFIWPGRVRPAVVPARAATLADEEMVIGVVANGKARAYRVRAFSRMFDYVVNDVVGDTPITVTHCDRTGCTRVFTGDGSEPLPIKMGGYVDGLILLVNGTFYYHEDGRPADPRGPPFPYRQADFEQATWMAWRTAHPDTDVYEGERPIKQPTP